MINYYVLEKYDFINQSWYKIREFSCSELDLAKDYCSIFRLKEKDFKFRLVGVVNV